MRKLILMICTIALIANCNTPKKSTPSENTEQVKNNVDLIVTNWHKAASEANFDNYFGAMDSLSFFIGTDAGENWTKEQFQSFSKPFFEKGRAWDFKTLERNVHLNKSSNIAWFDELLDTWMGTCRGSGVLEKTKNTWKIKHYVLSITIPNDDVQKVIDVKKEKDSLFLQKFKK